VQFDPRPLLRKGQGHDVARKRRRVLGKQRGASRYRKQRELENLEVL